MKFMPSSMHVANWGRGTYEVDDTTTNMEGISVKIPRYVPDTYQDNTRTYNDTDGTVSYADTIEMEGMELGVYGAYGANTATWDANYSADSRMKYAYRSMRAGETDKVYFIDDKRKEQLMNAPVGTGNTGYGHAYMFWLENVQYGTKKYDVLLTMDANHYRKYRNDGLDTTVNVDGMTQSELQSRISTLLVVMCMRIKGLIMMRCCPG